MQQRDIRQWLYDIVEACDAIADFTHGRSFEQYMDERILRSATERQFEIIGEALKRVLLIEAGLSLRFPDARGIFKFRDHLAHGYHITRHDEVWEIIRRDVPILRKQAAEILAERPTIPHDQQDRS